jgi:hypothetical protein
MALTSNLAWLEGKPLLGQFSQVWCRAFLAVLSANECVVSPRSQIAGLTVRRDFLLVGERCRQTSRSRIIKEDRSEKSDTWSRAVRLAISGRRSTAKWVQTMDSERDTDAAGLLQIRVSGVGSWCNR